MWQESVWEKWWGERVKEKQEKRRTQWGGKKWRGGEETGGGGRTGRGRRLGGWGGERSGVKGGQNINDQGQGKVEGQYESYSPYHNIVQHMNGIAFSF